MGAPLVNKKSPLKQGITMAIVMFVMSLAWQTYKLGEFNKFVIFASVVGGLVGGLVYGIISYFRYR
ncbi:MAG: hypothetical protein DRI86_08060 [Bacteroidetes bacterium]|nr:MAG: hypothetical protein DRI86_08060 [Bacteroidota bacterium]